MNKMLARIYFALGRYLGYELAPCQCTSCREMRRIFSDEFGVGQTIRIKIPPRYVTKESSQ